MLNIYRIIKNTRSEGPGNRFCIWVQGCSRHCRGCFLKDTWSFKPNQLISPEELFRMISEEKNIEGVTILGGEPLEQAEELSELLECVSNLGLSVIVFTGFTYSEIKEDGDVYRNKILEYTDVLIDGEFIEEKKDFSKPLTGSSNQRHIFLTDRYKLEDFGENKIEIRISPDGKMSINGMGDFEKIEKKFRGGVYGF